MPWVFPMLVLLFFGHRLTDPGSPTQSDFAAAGKAPATQATKLPELELRLQVARLERDHRVQADVLTGLNQEISRANQQSMNDESQLDNLRSQLGLQPAVLQGIEDRAQSERQDLARRFADQEFSLQIQANQAVQGLNEIQQKIRQQELVVDQIAQIVRQNESLNYSSDRFIAERERLQSAQLELQNLNAQYDSMRLREQQAGTAQRETIQQQKFFERETLENRIRTDREAATDHYAALQKQVQDLQQSMALNRDQLDQLTARYRTELQKFTQLQNALDMARQRLAQQSASTVTGGTS